MITEIEKLNFYGWTKGGMKENPDIPIEDAFLLRSDVLALQKVSDPEWWEKEFLVQGLIKEGYDKTLAGNIVCDLEKIKNNRNENN